MFRQVFTKKGKLNYFQINGNGDVICTEDKEYILPTRIKGKKKQYKQVQLIQNGSIRWFYIHRLMGFSWLSPPKHRLLTIIDHIDGNSLNNRVDNLRWVTPTANNINASCYGLRKIDDMYCPYIAGYTHEKYGVASEELAKSIRNLLVQCYVRYNCRYPEKSDYPHNNISRF